jgi:hypothetical protein
MNAKLLTSSIVLISMFVGSMIYYLDLISGVFLNGLLLVLTFVWFGVQLLFEVKKLKS